MSDIIDPRVAERMEDPNAPKLNSKWMTSLPVIAKPKTWVYAILDTDNGILGKVQWSNRTYIFIPSNDPKYETRFYQSCLRAIADFIQALIDERKHKR